MLTINPTPAAAYTSGAPSFTSLQAQLQRYQQQLSDCVNCASADTPRGKSDIQAITARISQVQQRLAQADKARETPPPAGVSGPSPAAVPAGAPGAIIDVFA